MTAAFVGVNPVTPVAPYPDKDFYAVAQRLHEDGHLDGWTQRDGSYWQWTGQAYEQRSDKQLRQYLGYLLSEFEWAPNKSRLSNVIDAIVLPDVPDADVNVLSLANGLYEPISGTLTEPMPTRFISNSLPYPFDPVARCENWLAFLDTVWGGDPESVLLLQEWFGYLVSGSTAEQKALLMYGPKRSGKGTIMWVAEQLLGASNTGALKPSALSSWFGLQTVVGKSLAVIGDLRLDGRLSVAAVDSLLSMTGEDLQNIQRKGAGREPIDVRLRCQADGRHQQDTVVQRRCAAVAVPVSPDDAIVFQP